MAYNSQIMKLKKSFDINNLIWSSLSANKNAITFIKENPDKICWSSLSYNPNAISILETNKDKIDWNILMTNPSIFVYDYDYETMKTTKADLNEEVIAKALHPKRIFRLIEEYGEDEIYDIYFDDY
jgi:hypothetical protein